VRKRQIPVKATVARLANVSNHPKPETDGAGAGSTVMQMPGASGRLQN